MPGAIDAFFYGALFGILFSFCMAVVILSARE